MSKMFNPFEWKFGWKFGYPSSTTKVIKLLSFVIILSVLQVDYSDAIEITSYARVSKNGDSIIVQSDRGNRNIVQTSKAPDVDSTLIDKHHEEAATTMNSSVISKSAQFRAENKDKDEDEGKRIKVSSEKSTGRAIQSNYYFPFSNLLTKPSRPINNDKVVVYPTYNRNTFNDNYQTRNQLKVMMPSTGLQYAQRRFQYSPEKFLRPLRGADSNSASQPSYVYPKPAATDSPSPPQPSPPDVFKAPINVKDSEPGTTKQHFMPTPLPPKVFDDSPTPKPNISSIDLLSFPKHVNTSYMPSELDTIKHSIDNNNHLEDDNDDETFKFPPNVNSNYLPPGMINNQIPINSYLPSPSGEQSIDFIDTREVRDNSDNLELNVNSSKIQTDVKSFSPNLFNFPPNINSTYLPRGFVKSSNTENSYLPEPSGDVRENIEINQNILETTAYKAPKNLYNFPPNINSNYSLPSRETNTRDIPNNSYFPQASGIEDDENSSFLPEQIFNFPPNIKSYYQPQDNVKVTNNENSYSPQASGNPFEDNIVPFKRENNNNNIETTYKPPENLFNFPPNINSNYLPPDMNVQEIPNNSYLPPASGSPEDVENPNHETPSIIPQPPLVSNDNHPHSHHHHHHDESGGVNGFDVGSINNFPAPPPPSSSYLPASEPAPMPSYLPPTAPAPMEMPHHHPHHEYLPSAPSDVPPDFSKYNFDPHADIIYDYDHHPHHHHHHHHEEEPTTTTTAAPEEPRVKKYSYYYLGRKLWYIPLYFTLWFCLYVVALIIRSIGRHKVDLPNHYVSRSLHDMSQKELIEKINRVAEFSMKQIEDFKEKYL